MSVKKAIQNNRQFQQQSRQKTFKDSTIISSLILKEILKKVQTDLPPDTRRVKGYSGLLMKQATQQILDVNLLGSQYIDNFTNNNHQESFYQSNIYEQNCEQKKNTLPSTVHSNSRVREPKTSLFGHESNINSPKLVQDEEIILKKQGVKFVKKGDLKNLIKYRSSDTFSSDHSSYNPTYQRINTKHSLYQDDSQKPEKRSFHSNGRSVNRRFNKTVVENKNLMISNREFAKSVKNYATVQQISKNKDEQSTPDNNNIKKSEINRQRISAMFNLNQFVNLEDYYQQKNKQLNKNRNKLILKENQQNSKDNQFLQWPLNNTRYSSWENRESQAKDEDDIVINRMRDRKEKFYRSENNFNEDLLASKNRQVKMIMSQSQKNSQKDQFGALVAFDYNGSTMPTIKYDALKIPQHYQDMDFAIMEQNESEIKKKKQRKGHMFGAGINLKLVDHQKFMPHPNYNYGPLVQKQGIQMKDSIIFTLKKGVQAKPKQDTPKNSFSLNTTNNEQEENKEKINKGNFDFLHDQQIAPKPVKFSQFLKYKKASQSGSKEISSKSKIGETSIWEDSLLSKKAISVKTFKTKATYQDGTNKVHKSSNPKTLSMLINNNHDDSSPFEILHFQNNQQHNDVNPPTGVLKKSSINRLNKLTFDDSDRNFPKKKVRIA